MQLPGSNYLDLLTPGAAGWGARAATSAAVERAGGGEITSAPGPAGEAAALHHQKRLWSRCAPSFPISRIPSYNAFITVYCDVCRQQYRLLLDNINNTLLNAKQSPCG